MGLPAQAVPSPSSPATAITPPPPPPPLRRTGGRRSQQIRGGGVKWKGRKVEEQGEGDRKELWREDRKTPQQSGTTAMGTWARRGASFLSAGLSVQGSGRHASECPASFPAPPFPAPPPLPPPLSPLGIYSPPPPSLISSPPTQHKHIPLLLAFCPLYLLVLQGDYVLLPFVGWNGSKGI